MTRILDLCGRQAVKVARRFCRHIGLPVTIQYVRSHRATKRHYRRVGRQWVDTFFDPVRERIQFGSGSIERLWHETGGIEYSCVTVFFHEVAHAVLFYTGKRRYHCHGEEFSYTYQQLRKKYGVQFQKNLIHTLERL